MSKGKNKGITLREHRIAINKYIELVNEWKFNTGIHNFFIDDKFDFSNYFSATGSVKTITYIKPRGSFLEGSKNIEKSRYVPEPNFIYEFIQGLYAYARDLFSKIKNLNKIIKSYSKVTIKTLNFDRRNIIQSLKHNFRHFDEEENLELIVNTKNQHFNSNNLILWKVN